jgi:hypothetical protein
MSADDSGPVKLWKNSHQLSILAISSALIDAAGKNKLFVLIV